ncbi:hypothetical protein QO002_001636 [Pararhizobium capsulatum DSM 1112]|uniref:Uncharacterized protein n=1 Tax=Pararhizobium capsulatum DSM 1112 TaxID=1121113 RepID=A0ABU0BML1_9HYPH|nr:hypothetical protein [Pararhizobium capsulatum]MDQ0319498.1 hypothetical protein [Pararhizobium capsulatum DSM 1112]
MDVKEERFLRAGLLTIAGAAGIIALVIVGYSLRAGTVPKDWMTPR